MPAQLLPAEIIRRKRDGKALAASEIGHFVAGVASGAVSDAQIGALAMAICLRGMDAEECTTLTLAMRDSGERLDWTQAGFNGPVLDKHSTGGVGDLVSLVLAPMLAACGAYVPMISGRGLGHTGGTLDKLEAIPGYRVQPDRACLDATLRSAGCAIIGAGGRLAPADARIYAVRDVTATVDSLVLITASILSKKLAAGLDALVLDVKTGNGAQTPSLDGARELACSLVRVANQAGLPTTALITAMDQPLVDVAGNALEVDLALRVLCRETAPARLLELCHALGTELLLASGLASDVATARAKLANALESGAAAERFARMVALLGGPKDLLQARDRYLAQAPIQRAVRAQRAGIVGAIDTLAMGLAVVDLGGGRRHPDALIDARVGLSDLLPVGAVVAAGEALAVVHATDELGFERAAARVLLAYAICDELPTISPIIYERITLEETL